MAFAFVILFLFNPFLVSGQSPPVIRSAEIEYSVAPNLIYIHGENFGENEGTVTLGGVPFPLMVQTWHAIGIIAELPQVIPGDYVLTITTAEKPSYKANIELTIETAELQGSQEDPKRKSR